MPFKRKESPYYQIRKWNLAGYGDSSAISTGVTSKKTARNMERCLEEIAQMGLSDPSWYKLLDAVCKEKSISLTDLLAAKGRRTLSMLKETLCDPLLLEAIDEFRLIRPGQRPIQVGLDQLLHYAPKGARLSFLRDGRTITELCVKAANDPKNPRKRNSVHRYLLRSISLMVRHYLVNAERNRIFDDVSFSKEDDTREVFLNQDEVASLLDTCEALDYHELAVLIRVAIQTSADRGVLLAGKTYNDSSARGLLVRDVTIQQNNKTGEYVGELHLHDSKTTSRDRTVVITDELCRELLVLGQGKGADASVFNIAYMDLDYMWTRVREEAKLKHLRFKDLRAQFSIYAERAGIHLTTVMKAMGHESEARTRLYQRHNAVMTPDQAAAIERELLAARHAASA